MKYQISCQDFNGEIIETVEKNTLIEAELLLKYWYDTDKIFGYEPIMEPKHDKYCDSRKRVSLIKCIDDRPDISIFLESDKWNDIVRGSVWNFIYDYSLLGYRTYFNEPLLVIVDNKEVGVIRARCDAYYNDNMQDYGFLNEKDVFYIRPCLYKQIKMDYWKDKHSSLIKDNKVPAWYKLEIIKIYNKEE